MCRELWNAGADGCNQVLRIAAEMPAHCAHSLFDDALDRATPACVKNSNRAALFVDDDHRNAIGCLYGDEQPGSIGDEPVARERVLGHVLEMMGIHVMN